MDFVRTLQEAVNTRSIPNSMEIIYEERDGKNYRHLEVWGSGRVHLARQEGRAQFNVSATIPTAEIGHILSYLFVHEFWKVKSQRAVGRRVTLGVRLGPSHRVVTLPYAEIKRELAGQIDKGKMLERPAGRFLVATMGLEGLLQRMEKNEPAPV